MAYTERVLLSGTALSFLLYECIHSVNTQEGFLIGDVTSQITNHISDSNSDNARLDTQIAIRSILPLPSVSLFYFPTGRIKEDILSGILSNTASEVVGWYKYRKNSNIKPTFRDKLISKGLQKYFEKYHGKKNFVTCNLSNKTSSAGSTHTFTYRFGKINCFDMYEYIDDVTANLGEKLAGYKKSNRQAPHGVFHNIINDSNVQTSNANDAILRIQEAVDVRLLKEAKIAAKNEGTIRELEAEIKQMNTILSDRQAVELQATYNRILEEKFASIEAEMAEECVKVMKCPLVEEVSNIPNILTNNKNICTTGELNQSIGLERTHLKEYSPSHQLPILAKSPKPVLNYAAALKSNDSPSTSKSNTFNEDLISFDVEDKHIKKPIVLNVEFLGDSSPEY
ncbi:hypothetical protein ACJJTC_018809 [Scirpophaga incertulas]